MGRKRLPTNIKKASGTLQKCRTNFDEPKPLKTEILCNVEVPERFSNNAYAVDLFNRVVTYYNNHNLLSIINVDLIVNYVNEMCEYELYNTIIKRRGRFTKNGMKLNPAVYAAKKSLELALKLASELGITPSQHSKLIEKKSTVKHDDEDFR